MFGGFLGKSISFYCKNDYLVMTQKSCLRFNGTNQFSQSPPNQINLISVEIVSELPGKEIDQKNISSRAILATKEIIFEWKNFVLCTRQTP